MKKIEEKMVQAVEEMRNFSESNTRVSVSGNVVRVYLFDSCIYKKAGDVIEYDYCGYPTVTTASRLRALGAKIKFKRGEYIKFL